MTEASPRVEPRRNPRRLPPPRPLFPKRPRLIRHAVRGNPNDLNCVCRGGSVGTLCPCATMAPTARTAHGAHKPTDGHPLSALAARPFHTPFTHAVRRCGAARHACRRWPSPPRANPDAQRAAHAASAAPVSIFPAAPPAAVAHAAGSFGGRRPTQPPGGHSSITFGDSASYGGPSSAAKYGRPSAAAAAPAAAGYGYGAPSYSGAADLSSQLGLQSPGYQSPTSGRRAPSSYGYGASAAGAGGGYVASGYGAGMGGYSSYGAGAGGYGGAGASNYSAGGALSSGGYGAGQAAAAGYGGGSHASAYQAPYGGASGAGGGGYGIGYGAAASPSSHYGGAASPSHGYGGYAAGGGSAYNSGSYGASGYGGGGAAYGGAANASYGQLAAPSRDCFQPGQKGSFGGKTSMQPPGGKSSIVFG
uniref:Uncharacterized protein n=1 Tax=Chlamydomonas euryale TaxID=1486919 RepID=A0A7R9YXB0_9CHLO|mmetsp:Transcript_32614/g.97329  ORF Transcript_32614/g.97329 Transcript_32614/m.97329 type:complete len:418 (+) Transcript_32614:314-1567(+)